MARARVAAGGRTVTGAVRVLLVDDQTLVRAGFRALLDSEPDIEVVGEAVDGEQAVALALATTPDVVLMDIRMPRVDGLQATARITGDARLRGTRVVVLTTFELDEYVFGALRAGASGFLLKDIEPVALIDAVRLVHDGQALVAPQVTRRLIEAYVATGVPEPVPAPAPDTSRLADLTPREREVLALVGRGLSNHEIAAHLVLSPLTAKTHVSRLFTKLGARDRAQLVVTAYETGILDA
ncbi:response regulator transcription factor [Nocardioides dongxiaopingii]|uniref:response regulator transcription factor n=1 Tax=Nocardioides dongxiaopingii TaxID=2576036 RepID=UPI001FEC59B4|nr:response regulator transcription factor [Nocardioides dongxiaopingii]